MPTFVSREIHQNIKNHLESLKTFLKKNLDIPRHEAHQAKEEVTAQKIARIKLLDKIKAEKQQMLLELKKLDQQEVEPAGQMQEEEYKEKEANAKIAQLRDGQSFMRRQLRDLAEYTNPSKHPRTA